MDKVREKFFYLRMKSRGYSDEVIQDELEVTQAEFEKIEEEYGHEVAGAKLKNEEAKGIGHKFMNLTSSLYGYVSDQMNGVPKPETFKTVTGEVIKLPNPQTVVPANNDFRAILEGRRSVRDYSKASLSKDELSYLLWLTQGVREVKETQAGDVSLRTTPSAGATHPLETYLLINRVEGIEAGLYFYNAKKHDLILLNSDSDLREKIWIACNRQKMIKTGAVTFLWSATPYRTSWKYIERSWRYIHLDAGHVCQNLYLAAESINCGVCAIGSYVDEFINEYLGLDGEKEFVIYIASLGKKVDEK